MKRRLAEVVFVWCCVYQHPVSKICRFFGRLNCHFDAEENVSDLLCCTHGSVMGAEQLYVRRVAKAARTGMMLTITITLASSK
jgi:hypothetical protein